MNIEQEKRNAEERYYKIKNHIASYPCSEILKEADTLSKEQWHKSLELLNEIERLNGIINCVVPLNRS